MDTSKLPKWAQEHIQKIERQRDDAVKALNEYVDNQTESPFYFEDWVSTGEDSGPTTKRVYIQTNQIVVEYAGVELEILLRKSEDHINLQWHSLDNHTGDVALIPHMYQSAKLVSKENMN